MRRECTPPAGRASGRRGSARDESSWRAVGARRRARGGEPGESDDPEPDADGRGNVAGRRSGGCKRHERDGVDEPEHEEREAERSDAGVRAGVAPDDRDANRVVDAPGQRGAAHEAAPAAAARASEPGLSTGVKRRCQPTALNAYASRKRMPAAAARRGFAPARGHPAFEKWSAARTARLMPTTAEKAFSSSLRRDQVRISPRNPTRGESAGRRPVDTHRRVRRIPGDGLSALDGSAGLRLG